MRLSSQKRQTDYEQLASEFVRALRGARSQMGLSRQLGYRSNVLYTWEAGRRYPTACETLRMTEACGRNLASVWRQFYGNAPLWIGQVDTTRPAGLATVLNDLRGRASRIEVADQAGLSRHAVSRWLNAQTEPRLPDFFRLLDALTYRLLDLLALFVSLDKLPAVAEAWTQTRAQRRLAFEAPMSQAVLLALEFETTADRLELEELATRLGISSEQVQQCLAQLNAAGLVRCDEGRWVACGIEALDTRGNPEQLRRLKAFWAELGQVRLQNGNPGLFSYNVFGVSEAYYHRLRKLHQAYYRQLRSIIADSPRTDRVVVTNLQLFPLDDQP